MEGGTKENGSLGLISFAASTVALVAYMYKRSEKYRVGVVRPRKGIWKHDLARKALPEEMLQKAFKRIKEDFEPQLVTYKGQRWKISTYMELDNSGHISGKHKVEPDVKMLDICREMLDECTRLFEIWYNSDRKLKYCKAERLHSFVTRYLPIEGQDQLKKHIDGRHRRVLYITTTNGFPVQRWSSEGLGPHGTEWEKGANKGIFLPYESW